MRFPSAVASVALALFAAIAFPLFARVANVVDVSLSEAHDVLPLTFVRILPEPTGSGDSERRTHRTRLGVHDASRLLRHGRVGFLVGTLGTQPDLEGADLVIEGTDCVYATAAGAAFPNNRTLDLLRGDGCVPLQGTPSGRMELTVRLRNRARVVLWVHPSPPDSITTETIFVDPDPEPRGAEVYVPSGRLVDPGAPADRHRRIDLLAYLWQVGSSGLWIWTAVTLGVLAVSTGSIGLWSPSLWLTGGAAARGLSASVLVIGLGGLYAVLTPPFQAPDEPHHFVAFAALAGRPALAAQADEWAARGHVKRLRFRPAERFTPADIATPQRLRTTPEAPNNSVRGRGIHVLWKSVAPLLRSMPAPLVFLGLRLLNVFVLAVLVGVSVALLIRYGQVPSPHLLAFPIFFIPTLPFFGMHLSNHGPLIAVYVLISSGLLLVVLNRRSDPAGGLLIGCGWALAIALSRSAVPLAPMIAAIAGARLLFGPGDRQLRATALFWTALIVPLLLLLMSGGSAEYVALNTRIGGAGLPPSVQVFLGGVTRSPWLLALAIPMLVILELSFCRLRSRSGPPLRSAASTIARWGAAAAAVALGVLMVGSMFLSYPVLATIDPANRPPALEYTRDAVRASLTMLRLGGPDYRTSMTFWGGFGWLETLPPAAFVSLLTGMTGLAVVALLRHVARTSDVRRAVFLAASLAGFAASIAAYAFSLTQVEAAIDVAGRYVFGLYLAAVMICWSGISLLPPGTSSRYSLRSAVSISCVVACIVVHAYCLRLILYRYF